MRYLKLLVNNSSNASILLFLITLFTLLVSNSSWNDDYNRLLTITWVNNNHISLKSIINDGLMVFFFMQISIEAKREILIGELSSYKKASLPVVGACGGVLIPACIFLLLNKTSVDTQIGWAIPTATDIAFVLAICNLFPRVIPYNVKIILITLAIIDDIIAILIIALFYTKNLHLDFIVLGLITWVCLIWSVKNSRGHLTAIVLSILLWIFVILAEIHATLAGVLIASTIPLKSNTHSSLNLESIETALHPFIYFFVVPLFAFANAGLVFHHITLNDFLHPLTMGIFLGLFLGKPLGIFMSCYIGIKTKWLELPSGLTMRKLFGLGMLSGIGFTMSLFIGTLAFKHTPYIGLVKLGVFSGSLCAAIFGCLIFFKPATKT